VRLLDVDISEKEVLCKFFTVDDAFGEGVKFVEVLDENVGVTAVLWVTVGFVGVDDLDGIFILLTEEIGSIFDLSPSPLSCSFLRILVLDEAKGVLVDKHFRPID
jgi:hypothetical protein